MFETVETVIEDPMKQVKLDLQHWQQQMDEALQRHPRSVWVKLPTEIECQERHSREVENRRRQTYRAIDQLLKERQLKATSRGKQVLLEWDPSAH